MRAALALGMGMRIAALDDDAAQVEAVQRAMVAAGHTCQCFLAAKALMTALRRETFDLLIVDWNMPEVSGLQTIAWLRENLESPPPVLLLTSRSAEADIVEGLNAGADDYVVKPVQPGVLMARVNALIRRAYPAKAGDGLETFGEYVFNAPAETVSVSGKTVVLTSKEFGLALLLFRNTHRALSRAHILEAVWGRNPDLATRTLDMHISRIRTKLNLRPLNGFRLAPIYSYGYRLERLNGDDAVGGPD
jgi:DNA-binding response OmpR family regulator